MGDSPNNRIDPDRERLGRMMLTDSVKKRVSGERERLGRMSLKGTPRKPKRSNGILMAIIVSALIIAGIAIIVHRKPKGVPEEKKAITETTITTTPTKELELPRNIGILSLNELNYYMRLANEGDRVAQYIIGVMYSNDTVYSEANMEKSFEYISLSAQQGYPPAYIELGILYYDGEYVEKNRKTAVEWFQKAADAGHPSGLYNIGVSYYYGDVYEQDYEKAFSYFSDAVNTGSNSGSDKAHLYLGYCYWDGKGVEKDEEKALREWREAANKGVGKAYIALVEGYWNRSNFEQAYTWARKAADTEVDSVRERGLYYMALFYETGTIVGKDLEKAKALLLEAQEIGGKDYSEQIARVEKEMEK